MHFRILPVGCGRGGGTRTHASSSPLVSQSTRDALTARLVPGTGGQACRNPVMLEYRTPAWFHFFQIFLVIWYNCLQIYRICLQIWTKLSANVASSWNSRLQHSGVSADLLGVNVALCSSQWVLSSDLVYKTEKIQTFLILWKHHYQNIVLFSKISVTLTEEM